MPSEIYNSLDLQKSSRLDSRLDAVSTYANLPDLTDASLFLFEGATIYVSDETSDYQAQYTIGSPTVLVWVKLISAVTGSTATNTGSITITPGTTNLDLSLVNPAVATCNKVVVSVSGGTSATITSITNWPAGLSIAFSTYVGQSVKYIHTDYDVAGLGDMVIEDGADMTLTGRTIGDESLTLKENGVTFVQVSATQFIKTSELAQNLLSIVVTDNLTTTSTTSALSANQGVVLNGLINTKQSTITPGDNLSFAGNTLNAEPWPWTITSVASITIGTTQSNYLTTTWGSTTQKFYRLVDFTTDGDKYMLPVGLNPSVVANWIHIDQAPVTSLISNYPSSEPAVPQSDLINTLWYPRFSLSGVIGDSSSLSWISGLGGNNVGFAFSKVGLYKVKFKLNMADDGSVPTRFFIHSLHQTDGVGLSTDPTSTSVAVVDQFITTPYTEAAIAKNYPIVLETLVEVSTIGINNGFVVEVWSSTGDYTGYTHNATAGGFLEIIKIRS